MSSMLAMATAAAAHDCHNTSFNNTDRRRFLDDAIILVVRATRARDGLHFLQNAVRVIHHRRAPCPVLLTPRRYMLLPGIAKFL